MAYDDEPAPQQNSPLVPWILVVAAAVLGVGASYNFYVGRESAMSLLKIAKQNADDYRQKAANADSSRLNTEQQLADAQGKLKAVQSDKDLLTARVTDCTNQLTQAQTAAAPAAKGGKKAKPTKKRHR
jgi:hypothetical protein